jgi:hypothetical protein
MVYKKTREKTLRMSVVVLNSEHKSMTSWFKTFGGSWQEFLHNFVEEKCKELEVERQLARNQKLLAKEKAEVQNGNG